MELHCHPARRSTAGATEEGRYAASKAARTAGTGAGNAVTTAVAWHSGPGHSAAALPSLQATSVACAPGPMPEIAWIRLSSVTSSDRKVRMMRPEYMAMMRSDTCSTSGISELMTMTA